MTGEIGETREANAEMTAAAQQLSAMPAELYPIVRDAIISGMNQVTIVVDDRGIGAISDRVRGGWGNAIMNMTK